MAEVTDQIPGQLAFDAIGAEVARQEGIDRADTAPRVQMWKVAADFWLAARPAGYELTADDLVEAIGLPDPPARGQNRNNVVGAVIAAWSATRRIEWTGRWGSSTRVIGHRNPQRVWRRL